MYTLLFALIAFAAGWIAARKREWIMNEEDLRRMMNEYNHQRNLRRRSKKENFWPKFRRIFFLVPLALLILSSCSPKVHTLTQREIRDSIHIIEVPREILVPGGVVRETVNYDSLRRLLALGVTPEVINRTLVRYDTSGNVQLRMLIDNLGNLTAICEAQDQLIQALDREIYHLRTEREAITQTITPKNRNWYLYIIIGLLLSVIIFLSIRLFFARV
jgi:hypothetical protein